MTYGPVGLSYPKHRDLQTVVFTINRTDSGTQKCTLPKDAVIVDAHVYQVDNAATATGGFSLGMGTTTNYLLNTYVMTTNTAPRFNDVGNSVVGNAAAMFTKLTVDTPITSTYIAGSSSAGGTGYVTIKFFVAGGGEAVDD